ncbi:MAG: hypothetical protein M1819_006433 [Sarea resinae]|nr:MAG: hypothetical protein M1819_006433 [Sarea resinae]
MAPLTSNHRKPFNPRSRGRGRPRVRHLDSALRSAEATIVNEAPPKKRRYIPGGPGGGGRYVDIDGTETPVGGTGPGGYAYVGPRGRIGRENAANGVIPSTSSRPRRERVTIRPRYSSAAAAAAAVVQGDGYKPREERGWEEFHQDLDIDAKLPVFSADEVDGIVHQRPRPESRNSKSQENDGHQLTNGVNGSREDVEEMILAPSPTPTSLPDSKPASPTTDGNPPISVMAEDHTPLPAKRRAGRAPRRQDLLLNGIGSPNTPKRVPLPGPNPRERLTLPKPSFRTIDSFALYEHKITSQQDYVDRTMANIGYQESDIFIRPERTLIRAGEGTIEEDLDLAHASRTEGEVNTALGGSSVGRVEYDMDEQDDKWLEAFNTHRKLEEAEPIKPAIFEITMTKIEKEWHALEKRIPKPSPKPPQTHRPRSSSAAAVNGEPSGPGEEQDSKCAICDDGDCENTNAIVFCDGCDLAVHQECYGVPFIPEGQWLCRKCQLIGRGTPTCIFCPNVDGAFKQTNSSRWSHLLCAIWIPEVTLGNSTFMEPVMDVEKVPRQRWKLTCYICRQKMGACIQCGNKNCFIAFHVTCARRAQLFLKMKSTHSGAATLDASVLKAYCDKHVPSDWRREHNVDSAITEAQDFYHHTMRGRLWADSQQSALTRVSSYVNADPEPLDDPNINTSSHMTSALSGTKRKRDQGTKMIWRLPSGAPVIPQSLYDSVELSLQRFNVRKRKEYAAEACKYWTLKREARRGAALLKRLQLQMETFSSMEITRRNFAAMGPAGRVRLQRRIDFAEMLQQDIEKLRGLCELARQRESEKLKDVEILRDVVETIYFPVVPLLWPVIEKARSLDGKHVFMDGFDTVRANLEGHVYSSVKQFAADIGTVFSTQIRQSYRSKLASNGSHHIDYRDQRRLAKRIIKAIKCSLEDAISKEADLWGRPVDQDIRSLNFLLENSIVVSDSLTSSGIDDASDDESGASRASKVKLNGEEIIKATGIDVAVTVEHRGDMSCEENGGMLKSGHRAEPVTPEFDRQTETVVVADGIASSSDRSPRRDVASTDVQRRVPSETGRLNQEYQRTDNVLPDDRTSEHSTPDPPTQPRSAEEDILAPQSAGGIPWYLEPFDLIGTTIYEERWTGREVVRGMSEELSEIDEEELRGLVDDEMNSADGSSKTGISSQLVNARPPHRPSREKKKKIRRPWRGVR